MKVAVTGAGGFVGAHLVEHCLENGYQVRALSRSPRRKGLHGGVQWFQGDLCGDTEPLKRFLSGVDVLFHCAGELHVESSMYGLHVEGTRKLLDASVGNVGRWVHLSSVGVYGAGLSGRVHEGSEMRPVGSYETTKAASDLLLKLHAEANNIEYVIAQPSNIFGLSMSNQSLFQLIWMLKRRMFFFIGSDSPSANYVDVKDVVQALIKFGESKVGLGESYIISQTAAIGDVVSAICDGLSVAPPNLVLPERLVRSAARAFQGFPRFPLTEGRIDALTGKAWYDDSKVRATFDFGYSKCLEDGFRGFAMDYANIYG